MRRWPAALCARKQESESVVWSQAQFRMTSKPEDLFFSCTNFTKTQVDVLALVRGSTAIVCFCLCLVTFIFELIYISRKKKSTTLQRLFIYLTVSNLFYTAALSLHLQQFFHYDIKAQDRFCEAIGFFDQYTGSVQLLLTTGIILKLFHKVSTFCCATKFSRNLTLHHYKFEAVFVAVCFILPLFVVWVPFLYRDGPGQYDVSGPWCWIRELKDDCSYSNKGFLEQLLLWYIPFAVVSFLCLICIIAIIAFLIYIHFWYRKYRIKIHVVITDMLLLLPFLVVFVLVCIVETTLVILLRKESSKKVLNNYVMWMIYAVTTPIGGVVIPIAFFVYFLRKKKFKKERRLANISTNARTVQPSTRVSANSYTSQQERPHFLSNSDIETDSVVVVDPSIVKNSKYGAVNIVDS